MKKTIWIDYNNRKQVDWWNKTASNMVSVIEYHEVVHSETNKPVGVIFVIKGIFSGSVVRQNKQFTS